MCPKFKNRQNLPMGLDVSIIVTLGGEAVALRGAGIRAGMEVRQDQQ